MGLMPLVFSCSVIPITQMRIFSDLQSLVIQFVIALILVLVVYKNEVKNLGRLIKS